MTAPPRHRHSRRTRLREHDAKEPKLCSECRLGFKKALEGDVPGPR